MKKTFLALTLGLFSVVGIFTSCEEDENRYSPLFDGDNIAPTSITGIEVENLPGGAKITYNVPDESDALFVEAKYTLGDGTLAVERSSVFKNEVIVEGLRETALQTVELSVIDKSNNFSNPVTVDIQPKTAPIDLLVDSFNAAPDFGGIRLDFDNFSGNPFEIQLLTKNESGIEVHQQSFFTDDPELKNNTFRTFEDVEREFKFIVIDQWGQVTEPFAATITPLKEIMLDPALFKSTPLPTDTKILSWSGQNNWTPNSLWEGTKLWDGFGSIFHTPDVEPNPIPIIPPYTEPNYVPLTWDLGQLANLSRIKIYPADLNSGGKKFTRGNVKRFELWGVDEIPADEGATMNGWSLLVKDGEIIKPSGLPYPDETADDTAFAAAGINIETDPIPTIRYLRMIIFETWEPTSNWVFMAEIEVFGNYQ